MQHGCPYAQNHARIEACVASNMDETRITEWPENAERFSANHTSNSGEQ
jgi:hypothetical protein